jgi:hypothetical protein
MSQTGDQGFIPWTFGDFPYSNYSKRHPDWENKTLFIDDMIIYAENIEEFERMCKTQNTEIPNAGQHVKQ